MANAKVTGNVSLLYDLVKENGEWAGESEQRINLGIRGKTGLERLLGLNIGFVRRGKESTFLGGMAPTYALTLQGKHYNLSSGYSVNIHRNIVNSRLYENLSVFLPDLPIVRFTYAKQSTRDTQEEHKTNSTGNNMQLRMEDEIGPFRITLNKREYTSKNLIRGPKYDVKSSNTSGNVDFTYLYRRLLSLNGRYGIDQLNTERKLTGGIKGTTQDFSLGFRISPVPTIALSGATVGQREHRENSMTQAPMPMIDEDSTTNRLSLMLRPVEGMLLNAFYSMSDRIRNEEKLLSNETRALTLNIEPRRDLVFSGHFMAYDSEEEERRSSTLRRNSFDVRAEPIEGLQILSRLDLSRSTNFASGLRSNRNSVTTGLEAMLTRNFRADLNYDWQKSRVELEGAIDEETQHRVTFAANYSFLRMLDLNLKASRNMSSVWKGSTTSLDCGFSCSIEDSHVSLRYNRASRPSISLSPLGSKQQLLRTTRTFSFQFSQEVNRDTRLFLSYESRLGNRRFGYSGTKRISFRVNTRF